MTQRTTNNARSGTLVRELARAFLLGLSCLTSACTAPLLTTPPRFLELQEPKGSNYDYRATTADGVVLAVRALDMDERRGGDIQFWVDATQKQLTLRDGYALLETREVQLPSGRKGKQLQFGHDEKGKPYHYWLTLFLTDDKLFVIEAGGPAEILETQRGAIETAIASLRD